MAPGDWAYKLYDAYIAAVIIRLEGVNIMVINILGNKKVIIIERFIKLALDKVEREIILINNFNTYYPIWGGRAAAIDI